MAVALRYNSKFSPKAAATTPKTGFNSLDSYDPNDFNADGSFKNPAMGTQGGKYFGALSKQLGWGKNGPPAPGSFDPGSIGDATGGPTGGSGVGSVSGGGSIDPGLAATAMGFLGMGLGAAPGVVGTVSDVASGALGAFGTGTATGTTTSGHSGDEVDVTMTNVPTGLMGAITGPAMGISVNDPAAPSLGEIDSNVDPATGMAAGIGSISASAGYTDPAEITAGAPGEAAGAASTSPTADAPGSISAGTPGAGGVSAGGSGGTGGDGGAGGGAGGAGGTGGGAGDGAGESPHTGGYIAGGPATAGFNQLADPTAQAFAQLRQLLTMAKGLGGTAVGGRRRSEDDAMGLGPAAGSVPSAQLGFGAESLGGGAPQVQQAFAPAPAAINEGGGESFPSGDAGAPSGDAGAGDAGDAGGGDAGDAGGVGADGSSGDAGGAGGAFHAGGYVGESQPNQDVIARLQPGEFVVPKGPFAEMLRSQNPSLTKYGDMLVKSPIKDVIDPRQAAQGMQAGLPLGAIIKGTGELIKYGLEKNRERKKFGEPQPEPLGDVTDAPEQGGFPLPGAPEGHPGMPGPAPGNNNAPPQEQREPETPGARYEQGMHKLKSLVMNFR